MFYFRSLLPRHHCGGQQQPLDERKLRHHHARLSSGDRSLPRACTLVSSWVQEGSVEGSSAAPMRQLTGQDAGPFNPWKCRGSKEDEAAEEAAAPRAPDLRGERVRPPDSAPYLDPSFQNTAPPSQPSQHDEDTRSPVCFRHFIPFGQYIIISVE